MSLKTLIINNKYLYDILKEICVNFNFQVINGLDKNIDYESYDNYLFITTEEVPDQKNQVLVKDFPIKIKKLIELININFLKKNYSSQSSIDIGKYKLDLNSRILNSANKSLNLTEMEANVIMFLKNSKKPSNIKELQNRVWGQVPDLETHTVETHIYRLRKKIKDKFQDDYFINSTKYGYEIK
jgi:hypothetical protein